MLGGTAFVKASSLPLPSLSSPKKKEQQFVYSSIYIVTYSTIPESANQFITRVIFFFLRVVHSLTHAITDAPRSEKFDFRDPDREKVGLVGRM